MSGTEIRLEWRIAPRPDGRGGHYAEGHVLRIDISAPTALTAIELEHLAAIATMANTLGDALRVRHTEQEGTTP